MANARSTFLFKAVHSSFQLVKELTISQEGLHLLPQRSQQDHLEYSGISWTVLSCTVPAKATHSSAKTLKSHQEYPGHLKQNQMPLTGQLNQPKDSHPIPSK